MNTRAQARGRAPRANDLARIHIGAQRLGLITPDDDSTYRDMLWSVARVRSARELDYTGRARVIHHLTERGAFARDARQRPGRYNPASQAALIRHIWTMLGAVGAVEDPSDRALRRYCAGQLGSAVAEVAPQHLDQSGAATVIERLKRWCSRVGITRDMIRNGEIPPPSHKDTERA